VDTYRLLRSLVSLLLLALALPAMAAAGRSTNVSGQIVSLSTAAQTLTVQTGDGSQAIFHVTPNSHLWRNSSPVGLAGLALRDTVLTAQVDRKTLSLVSLRARGPAITTTRGGLLGVDPGLQSLSVGTAANPHDFLLTPATLFVRNGHAATAADLTARDSLLVHALVAATSEPVAADVEADGPEEGEVEGTISAVAGGDVTITSKQGKAVTVHVNDSTMIRLHLATGETAGTLADLKVGLRAGAEYDPVSFVAFSIEARPAAGGGQGQVAHVVGTVGAVDAGAGTIAIDPKNGTPVSLTINSSTRITRNGSSATLADVKTGDQAAAEYDPTTNVATRIEAETDSEHEPAAVEGQVTAASPTSVTIAPHSGDPVSLTLDASTVVFVNGKPGTAADIKVGDQATALYDSTTKIAAKIAVEHETEHQNAEIEGQVTAASPTSVTITPREGGSPVTLTLNASTVILVNGRPGTAADIKLGSKAAALYDSTTKIAAKIAVESETEHQTATVEGQVTAASSTSVTITPEEDGSPVTLTLNASTVIVANDKPGTAADIKVGARAQAVYDRTTLVALGIRVATRH
jgi:hypothetical protein